MKYKYLKYLPKYRGGRFENVATFLSSCERKGNAGWIVEKTLQAGEESVDDFSHVGLSKLLDTEVIVKIMKNGARAQKEKHILEYFREHPYKNIVQGLCVFECKDNPIRWNKSIVVPQPICLKDGQSNFIIVVQEYIKLGSVRDNDISAFKKSIVLQLIYASLEWFDTHNFIYEDWHIWNILLDTTDDKTRVYNAFGKKFTVETLGYSPVLTDFGRSTFIKNKEPTMLSDQISLILDIFQVDEDLAIKIGNCEDIKSILKYIKRICW